MFIRLKVSGGFRTIVQNLSPSLYLEISAGLKLLCKQKDGGPTDLWLRGRTKYVSAVFTSHCGVAGQGTKRWEGDKAPVALPSPT